MAFTALDGRVDVFHLIQAGSCITGMCQMETVEQLPK
jgi:hypothetical protein